MHFHLRNFCRFTATALLFFCHAVHGAEVPNLNFELAFFPTTNGVPVPGATAFIRTYSLAGPTGGGLLLPGMRLEQGARNFHGTDGQSVYQYSPQTQSLQLMDTSSTFPDLSGPMSLTYDSRLARVVMVSNGGEGILYNYIVPDPTNAPSSGVWSFLASMDNVDVDTITYLSSQDAFYAVTFSFGPTMPARIVRIAPNGAQNGTIPLPALPFDIGPNGYKAELVTVLDQLVLLLEPRPGVNATPKESRIYFINPVTSQVDLTYSREIDGTPSDTTPPTVEMRSPQTSTNVLLGLPVQLAARAVDVGGSIDAVEFLSGGALIGRGAVSAGDANIYAFNWTNPPLGTNIVSARATDLAGNISISVPVSVVIYTNSGSTNPPVDSTPPFVQMRTPSNGDTVEQGTPILVTAQATDAGGIDQVRFLRNGSPIGLGAVLSQPGIYALLWSNAPLGTNILAALATDASGNSTTSAPVSILILSNSVPVPVPTNRAPVIAIVHPEENDTFTNGPIRLTAEASDSDGSIRVVDFFVNDTLVGTNNAPGPLFSMLWTPPSNGVYHISARATDNRGASSHSRDVRITVGELPQTDLISARRSLPDKFRPGHPFGVEIKVRAQRGVESWTVEDRPPAGWRVIGISHGGQFDTNSGLVRFGPFDKRERTLKYHLISSKTNTGAFSFTGIVTADGESEPVSGDSQINANPKHKWVKIGKGKDGKFIIRFDPDEAPRWIIEFTESLRNRDWQILPDATVTVSENGEISINDPTPNAERRFYRLRLIGEDGPVGHHDNEEDDDDADDNHHDHDHDHDDDDDDDRDRGADEEDDD